MRSVDGMLFLDYLDGLQESRSKLSSKVFMSSCLDMKIYDAERYILIIAFIVTCLVNSSRVSSDAAASSKSLPTSGCFHHSWWVRQWVYRLLSPVSTIWGILPWMSAGELEGRVGSYELRTPWFRIFYFSCWGMVQWLVW